MAVSLVDKGINTRQRAEQHVRAYRDVKEKGAPAEPDKKAVANAQQLRATLDPLHESTPQIEETKQQARNVLKQQDDFTQAWLQRESELRSKEGPSNLAETVDDGVALKGIATAIFGLFKMAKVMGEDQMARHEQELRTRYPDLYPQPKKPE